MTKRQRETLTQRVDRMQKDRTSETKLRQIMYRKVEFQFWVLMILCVVVAVRVGLDVFPSPDGSPRLVKIERYLDDK